MPKIERIKKRHLLKKREQRDEIARIEKEIGSSIKGLDESRLEGGVLDDGSRILLRALLNDLIDVPRITVDMGAVRFVVNGADIMRPGITEVDDRVKGNGIVVVVDENHGKPLAVGISKMSAEELRAATSGKVIKSIHHINDDLWVFGKD
jgi:PUA domain protein